MWDEEQLEESKYLMKERALAYAKEEADHEEEAMLVEGPQGNTPSQEAFPPGKS